MRCVLARACVYIHHMAKEIILDGLTCSGARPANRARPDQIGLRLQKTPTLTLIRTNNIIMETVQIRLRVGDGLGGRRSIDVQLASARAVALRFLKLGAGGYTFCVVREYAVCVGDR